MINQLSYYIVFILMYVILSATLEICYNICKGFDELSFYKEPINPGIISNIRLLLIFIVVAVLFDGNTANIAMALSAQVIAIFTLLFWWGGIRLKKTYCLYPWEYPPTDRDSRLCGPIPNLGYGLETMFRVAIYHRVFGPTTYAYIIANSNLVAKYSNTKLHDVYYD